MLPLTRRLQERPTASIGRCWNDSWELWRRNWPAILKSPLTQEQARREGSYAVAEEQALFDRQRTLLDEAVLDRIRNQDEAVFRFPGMFGGVAPLFQPNKLRETQWQKGKFASA